MGYRFCIYQATHIPDNGRRNGKVHDRPAAHDVLGIHFRRRQQLRSRRVGAVVHCRAAAEGKRLARLASVGRRARQRAEEPDVVVVAHQVAEVVLEPVPVAPPLGESGK